jgi:para-aminobenzoate synthetase component I
MPLQTIELSYLQDSADLFARIADLPWAAYLDSCQLRFHGAQQGRYDILTALPYLTLRTIGHTTEIQTEDQTKISNTDPFELLKKYLKIDMFNSPPIAPVPFTGGALGYFSYDLARRLEHLPVHAVRDIELPEMAVGFYDWAVVVDHQLQTASLVTQNNHPSTRKNWPDLLTRLQQPVQKTSTFHLTSPFTSNLTKTEYADAFESIQAYIQAGDCYQVNLSQRFSASFEGSPWEAYKQLRQSSPVPYGAYLNYPDTTILSLSPERFLQTRSNHVETKPIKGTRPRHSEASRDQQLADELSNSPKDLAENLMIVDLLRNDLGKNCCFGSIKVPSLFALESFPAVHHLVSTITGELAAEKSSIDLLRDCFPGGSITGAPKLRAMEIIEELEPHRRGLYCGAIGYIGFNGDMDTNIAIRTLTCVKNTIYCSAGGALVADSECEAEYQETLIKIDRLLQQLLLP